jgi:hypothetical protein
LLAAGEFPVEVQPKLLDIFFLRKFYIAYMDGWGRKVSLSLSTSGEYGMGQLGCAGF